MYIYCLVNLIQICQPVNYGPASRKPVNFELESRILIDKHFRSLELSMETFSVGAGGVLILFVKRMIKWQCLVLIAM